MSWLLISLPVCVISSFELDLELQVGRFICLRAGSTKPKLARGRSQERKWSSRVGALELSKILSHASRCPQLFPAQHTQKRETNILKAYHSMLWCGGPVFKFPSALSGRIQAGTAHQYHYPTSRLGGDEPVLSSRNSFCRNS